MQVRSEQTVAELTEGPLTVRKAALDLGREGVIGLRLTARSNADQPLTIELTEEFPGHVSMSDVQVHPSYHPERWSISEPLNRMVYAAEVHPGAEVQTVYGVRVADGNLDPFLDTPNVEVSAPSEEADGGAVINPDLNRSDDPADADRDPPAAAEPADSPPESAAASASGTTGSDPVETAPPTAGPEAEPVDSLQELFQFGDDHRSAAGTPSDPENRSPSGTAVGASAEASPQEQVESLVEALASIELTDAQRRRLAEALGVDAVATEGSTAVDDSLDRLAHLVAELERLVEAARTPAPRQTGGGDTSPDPPDGASETDEEPTSRRLSLLDRGADDRRDPDAPSGQPDAEGHDATGDDESPERSGRYTTDHEETIRSFSLDDDGD